MIAFGKEQGFDDIWEANLTNFIFKDRVRSLSINEETTTIELCQVRAFGTGGLRRMSVMASFALLITSS